LTNNTFSFGIKRRITAAAASGRNIVIDKREAEIINLLSSIKCVSVFIDYKY
jgi:hypothetical protein